MNDSPAWHTPAASVLGLASSAWYRDRVPEAEHGAQGRSEMAIQMRRLERRLERVQWRTHLQRAAAAALLLLTVGLASVTLCRSGGPDGEPTTRVVETPAGVELRAAYRLDESLVDLTVIGLPTPRPGRGYQLWVIQGDEIPRSLGVLPLGPDGVLRAQLDIALSEGHMVIITEEPDDGSRQPSSAPLVALTA